MENLNFNKNHKPENEILKEDVFKNLKTEVKSFSGNPGHYDAKEMHMLSEGKKIGELVFFQNDSNYGTIRISEIMLKPEYRGMEIGVKFYEELISYAKENNFNKVASGFSVKGGALVAWIKLAEKYQVVFNPEAKDHGNKIVEFKEIIQMYKDKKLPLNYGLHVSAQKKESVFEIMIEQK